MAYKDLRGSLNHYAAPSESSPSCLDEKIERFFFELAQEMGIEDVDMMNAERSEEFTLVYDKFSVRPR